LGVFAQLKTIALNAYDRLVGLLLDDLAVDGCTPRRPAVARSLAVHRSTAAGKA
jgi:hypothetical protein